ncbi:MAG: endonuclease/exonuclease/phosphatase family protein [Candidatus Methylumidiphilus sp.]
MLKFLLWNLNKKPLQDSIERLARKHNIDVIVLLENDITSDLLLRTLNPPSTGDYYFSPSLCGKVHIFCKFLDDYIKPVYESNRLTIRHLTLPAKIDILLAAVHFPSGLHWDDDSQAFECCNLVDDIIKSEKLVGHTRTLLMGDLNMNPYESGVISARGLHATMISRIAQEKSRIVQSREYQYFYNPMWSLFGDGSPGPAGTYYYKKAKHKVQFWHIFDQVLLRPDMISVFIGENLKILETDGRESFLNKQGIPDKTNFSDHLPVLFSLDI